MREVMMSRKILALLIIVILAVTVPALFPPSLAAQSNAAYVNSGLDIRFVLPRELEQVFADELAPDSGANFSLFSDAILLQTWEDVTRDTQAQVLGLYAGDGAHLLAANYPRHAFPSDPDELYDAVLSAFALTDHLLGATGRYSGRELVDVELSGGSATLVYQYYTILERKIEIWTAVAPHNNGTLILRFGALSSVEYPEWSNFEDEVTRTVNSIRVSTDSGMSFGWILYVLAGGALFMLGRRLLDSWQARTEIEKEEEYEAELEQAFGRTYSTTRKPSWTESFPGGPHITSDFSFPPRIQKALQEHDIYHALELAEELLQMAQEMQDLQAESDYRESIIRLRGMAATGAE